MHFEELQTSRDGIGPLFKRDFWSVICESTYSPAQITDLVAKRFNEFTPDTLCKFDSHGKELVLGQVISLRIGKLSEHKVAVVHRDSCSITLGTMKGHPEAGKITFGAYCNPKDDVIFHIRSCARSSSFLNYLGFIAVGEAMQTNMWSEFVNRVALTVGKGPLKTIHVETEELQGPAALKIEQEPGDFPTFQAKGD